MHMKVSQSVDELCAVTKTLLNKNQYKTDVYVRPTLYKSDQKIGTHMVGTTDSLLIFSLPMGDYVDVSKVLKVCVSNGEEPATMLFLRALKSGGAYANAALISTDARLAGFG